MPKPWWRRTGLAASLALGGLIVLVVVAGVISERNTARDPVEAPDLVGLDLAAARDVADEVGLDLEEEDTTGEDRAVFSPGNWTVEAQSPAAGVEVEPGSTITVTIGNVRDEDEAAQPADEPEPEVPETEPDEPSDESEPEPQAEPEANEPERDWLADFHESFGCGDRGWMECFDAADDPVGMDLAMKVMSVTSIESSDGRWFEVHMQTDDVDHAVWGCTYVRNLWTTSDDRPSVDVYGIRDGTYGLRIARTFMLDGNECRAS